ncbi:MAG: hypothetical protein ABR503_00035, partial [Chitinophagaceae bacterium]
MVPTLRKKYNELFTQENYLAFLQEIENLYPGQLDFRVAETPIFIPKEFSKKALDACESIIEIIIQPKYREQSKKAIPAHLAVPNEDDHPHCIAFDFGICLNDKGELEPQLIEMQGFPSLFAYEVLVPEVHEKHFWQPENYSAHLNGFTKASYIDLLSRIIIADCDPENVILLEIFPQRQKTRIDFYCTETYLGIKT